MPDYRRHRLPGVPRYAGSLWARYAVTDRFTLGSGIFAAGQREGNDANTFQLPGYVRWDAMAAYRFDVYGEKLTAPLNINNLLDKDYFSAASHFRDAAYSGEPITVLGSLRLELRRTLGLTARAIFTSKRRIR